jgi:hypothetical protein
MLPASPSVDTSNQSRPLLVLASAARHPYDPDFEALIAELHRDSQYVRDWWPGHDVRAVGSGVKKLLHPRLGPVSYSHVVLQVADNPDQTLVTYSPASGSP